MCDENVVTTIAPVGSRKTLRAARGRVRSDGVDAGVLDVGRVGQEQQHAVVAELGERREVRRATVERRLVDLEVAGVDDRADRRRIASADRVDDRVRHLDRLDGERADRRQRSPGGRRSSGARRARARAAARATRPSVSGVPYTGTSSSRSTYGSAPMWSSWPWVRTMPRKRSPSSRRYVEVGNDDVDAEHLGVGEHDAAVDGDRRVVVLEDQAVEADLAEPAERDDAQRPSGAALIGRRPTSNRHPRGDVCDPCGDTPTTQPITDTDQLRRG